MYLERRHSAYLILFLRPSFRFNRVGTSQAGVTCQQWTLARQEQEDLFYFDSGGPNIIWSSCQMAVVNASLDRSVLCKALVWLKRLYLKKKKRRRLYKYDVQKFKINNNLYKLKTLSGFVLLHKMHQVSIFKKANWDIRGCPWHYTSSRRITKITSWPLRPHCVYLCSSKLWFFSTRTYSPNQITGRELGGEVMRLWCSWFIGEH